MNQATAGRLSGARARGRRPQQAMLVLAAALVPAATQVTAAAPAPTAPTAPEAPTAPAAPPPAPPAPTAPTAPAPAPEAPSTAPEAPSTAPEAPLEPLRSATSSSLSTEDLATLTTGRMIDVLRALPAVAAIRAGTGAPALLLRGFDAAGGRDLEVTVDGVPLNVSGAGALHGHADPSFIIPETLERVALHRGPYAARHGAFASAGSLELRTRDSLPGAGAYVSASTSAELSDRYRQRGRQLHYRIVGMASPALNKSRALLAAEVGIFDGPFLHPQRLRRGAIVARWTAPVPEGTLRTTASVFSGRGSDSGLLPSGEVESGRVDRFGAFDLSLGTSVSRAAASAALDLHPSRSARLHLGLYAFRVSQRWHRNDTLFLRDPEHGDQIEQFEQHSVLGLAGWMDRDHRVLGLAGVSGQLRLGIHARLDDGRSELWHSEARQRLESCFSVGNPCQRSQSQVRDFAVFAEEALRLGGHVRMHAGVRLDQLTWDTVDGSPSAGYAGDAARARFQPKLGLTVEPLPGLALSALGGGGFRPGDPHAVTAAAALRAIPRLWAAELGASYQRPAFSIAAAAHVSWQAGELAWLPEARTLVSTPQVRRTALDARATVEPTSWLSLGVSFELAKALALAGQPHEHTLPLAPTFLGSAFALVRRCDSYASLRAAALGARLAALAETTGDQAPPSPERTASGHLLLQLTAGTRWRGISFALTVDNVLNSEWRQEQAAIATRPTPTAEVRPDVSFTPGEPRTLWLTVGIGG